GPPGATGATGPAGTPGISGLEVVTATSASSSTSPKSVAANCPAGKKVIGGGGRTIPFDTDLAIQESRRSASDMWAVTATETDATSASWAVEAQAICATVLP
ncbi:MAG: hypothetical protein M3356_01080, partial [Actinomycetota bacterium]|nr:hypothetical protein [Actinomycetota bacterium]